MRKKPHSAEEIVINLPEADVELPRGQTITQACRKIAGTDQIYSRWRREYGGMKVDQARRLKGLKKENARLERVVAAQALADHTHPEPVHALAPRRGDRGSGHVAGPFARVGPDPR